ncbi:hypothetical protein EYF80_056167 [Liparis tanakae]|uniref:Uncharacterized protein n=1 Tax=Liparis tanakae TaxID=230148 RepID=A0A4Z2EXJ9_9TELE|nr:hypothetical protein EYF80_056167 [Liparis tanakae]
MDRTLSCGKRRRKDRDVIRSRPRTSARRSQFLGLEEKQKTEMFSVLDSPLGQRHLDVVAGKQWPVRQLKLKHFSPGSLLLILILLFILLFFLWARRAVSVGSAPPASRRRSTSTWSLSTASCSGLRDNTWSGGAEEATPPPERHRHHRRVPGPVVSAAVDVGAVLHQVAHYAQPAVGAGLVQGAVPGVVSVVDVAEPALQTVQHHLLDRRGSVNERRALETTRTGTGDHVCTC